jgi:hypothetical protein
MKRLVDRVRWAAATIREDVVLDWYLVRAVAACVVAIAVMVPVDWALVANDQQLAGVIEGYWRGDLRDVRAAAGFALIGSLWLWLWGSGKLALLELTPARVWWLIRHGPVDDDGMGW